MTKRIYTANLAQKSTSKYPQGNEAGNAGFQFMTHGLHNVFITTALQLTAINTLDNIELRNV
jgi:hypothetical protein